MDFSFAGILINVIAGIAGFALFKAGRKNAHIPWMVIGALLIGYPYFVNGAWLLGGVGTALLALAYLMR